MMVLIRCVECEARFCTSNSDPGDPVEAECPECGAVVPASPDAYTTLRDAASEGRLSEVDALIEAGSDQTQADEQGRTALHLAAAGGHPAVVERLLDAGVEADRPVQRGPYEGETPLHLAAFEGHRETARLLLEEGASPNADANLGHTPLHRAAWGGRPGVTELLLEAGARPNATDRETGTEPLEDANRKNNPEVIELLLQWGVSPETLTEEGASPLFEMAESGYAGVVRQLLKDSADPNERREERRTPLHTTRDHDTLKELLEAGADPNVVDCAGNTPLHSAVRHSSLDIIEELLAVSDPNASDRHGRTPLHQATADDQPERVQLLLEAGADPDAADDLGRRPLHRAVGRDIAERLLAAGGDPNARDRDGKSPLYWAVDRGRPGVAGALLEEGARPETIVAEGTGSPLPDADFSKGRTALHWAVSEDAPGLVRVLLDKGVPVAPTDARGKTPLYLVADKGNPEIAERLIEEGGRLDASDLLERTPLHRAARWNCTELVEMLIEAGANPKAVDYGGDTPLDRGDPELWATLASRHHINFSQAALEDLAAREDPEVRQAVATRPDAEDVVALMRKAGSRPDLSSLSDKDPEPITASERDRLCEAGPYGKRLVTAHPDTPRDRLFELATEAPRAFLQNPLVQRKILSMENPGWRQELPPDTWVALLQVPEVPEEWVREGAKHDNSRVRAVVAGSEDAPESVLERLAERSADEDESVRRALWSNSTVPDEAVQDPPRRY